MKKVLLNGKMVHPIGIGTWHMGDHVSTRDKEIGAIRMAIDSGANVIDTAEMYGSGNAESLVGSAIKGYDRDNLFIISKFYPQNGQEPHLSKALTNSLSRLSVDYLDMYLLHWRGNIPLEKTVYDLENLVAKGLIRSWGVSNFDTADLRMLYGIPNGSSCAANENLYNMVSRGIEYDLLPFQTKLNLPLIAYAPIDQGDSRGANITQNNILRSIAEKRNVTIYQIMLAWVIRNGSTIAIPQSSNEKHVYENIVSATIKLTAEELMLIDSIYPPPRSKQSLDII
ncbi:hypothetical protein IGJ02_000206 [Enterococcus sp. DIV0724b]|uniref:aldo/keto reductase n=1 Tax=Enterococcus sp. DIV0724b TaxID=2774694 RepID=UPI003D2F9C24